MATSTIPNLNLSFDTTPTSGSSKPVTSNGIYNAIAQSTADEAKSYDINGTTWAAIYSQLSKLQLSVPACCSIGGQTMALLTGNKTSFAATGVVKCVNASSGVYEFLVTSDLSQSVYTWRISNFTSASATPTIGNVAIYQSTDTTFGSNSATSFDDLTTPGLFGVTISTTGKRPVSNIGSYAVIVLSGSLKSTNAAITQIAIPTGSNTPNGVYIRNRSAAGVWSAWYKISATAVA